MNRHGCCIWGREKPQEVWQHERDSPKLNFWRARRKLCIIGICFLTKQQLTVNVTVQCYKIKLNLLDTNFSQQDGAPRHCAFNVRRLFNDVFTDKWIARGGPIAWPGLSPNLPPLVYRYTMLLLAKMRKHQLLHRKPFLFSLSTYSTSKLVGVTFLPHLRSMSFSYTQFSESALSASCSQFLSRKHLLGVDGMHLQSCHCVLQYTTPTRNANCIN